MCDLNSNLEFKMWEMLLVVCIFGCWFLMHIQKGSVIFNIQVLITGVFARVALSCC